MLDFLRTLLEGPPAAAPIDARRAVAALLVEAAATDAPVDTDERDVIERFLREMFGVSPFEAATLRAEGEAAQAEAADVVRFTRVVKADLSEAERGVLLEALWSVVFSDGKRDPHEDALLRKLAPLIAVTDHDSAAARRRVTARLGLTD
ncbi:MAG: TerB family tellurite resistance protein [Rhodobacteraceae bacterium]|nr:MAG: TerB family tellurite resistance protein [Paracoccaceae bacterium]